MLRQTTFEDTFNVTSSPESAVGASHSILPDGTAVALCGQEAHRASRSRRPASGKAKRTKGTCGPISFDLSTPAGRIASLVSKSLKPSGTVGGMIYAMTWKRLVTPRGRVIYRLAASARRQSGSDCSGQQAGYPAPQAHDAREQGQAMLAGYCSPMAQDGTRGGLPPRPHDTGVPLSQQAALALTTATGSISPTVKRGRLNPALSAWLMGLPSGWLEAAPVVKGKAARASSKASETPSCTKLAPRSSKRSSKRSSES